MHIGISIGVLRDDREMFIKLSELWSFVPDIDDPETFDFNSIVSDIKKYCSAFDVVHHIALQGGEPFLHKNIDKVVKEIGKIPNLLFIDIVTNGTINPKDVTMFEIKKNGAAIVMSDYGEHSPKKSSLMSNCERHNVFLDYHVYTDRLWGAQFPIGKGTEVQEKTSVLLQSVWLINTYAAK